MSVQGRKYLSEFRENLKENDLIGVLGKRTEHFGVTPINKELNYDTCTLILYIKLDSASFKCPHDLTLKTSVFLSDKDSQNLS